MVAAVALSACDTGADKPEPRADPCNAVTVQSESAAQTARDAISAYNRFTEGAGVGASTVTGQRLGERGPDQLAHGIEVVQTSGHHASLVEPDGSVCEKALCRGSAARLKTRVTPRGQAVGSMRGTRPPDLRLATVSLPDQKPAVRSASARACPPRVACAHGVGVFPCRDLASSPVRCSITGRGAFSCWFTRAHPRHAGRRARGAGTTDTYRTCG